ncbi:kelch domain-containing protein [Apiospora phragmitis]|uniref:Kelch domain-containing protein n=1 Tax=Apiospora phragmitis TaxID=2905665 RepID=A0ABR1TPF8_9PEZI
MESFAKLKRRTTDLMESIPKNMPAMPQMPNMPNMPNMPQMPSMPHMPNMKQSGPSMKGTWQHIALPPLPRSSHSPNVVGGSAYIFGGEAEPDKPLDNHMHIVTLPFSSAPADYYSVPAQVSAKSQPAEAPLNTVGEVEESAAAAALREPLTDKGKAKDLTHTEVPAPRLGHATAVIGTRIFLFGGRGDTSQESTLDEGGRVWVFETKTHTWSCLLPASVTGGIATDPSLVPAPRSYHAAAATDKPREFVGIKPLRRTESWKEWAEGDSAAVGIPQRPVAGHIAENARDEEDPDAGFGTLFIHGGCLADGSRTNDVWAFDVHSRIWKQLPAAPSPARGGAALAVAKSRLYRFGGFDGESELGGQLDVLELGVDQFDDRVSCGEVSVVARGDWVSLVPPTSPTLQGNAAPAKTNTPLVPTQEHHPWPGARSVAGLQLVLGSQGREYLLLLLGERAPTADGHAAAGTFWDDVWAYQVPPQGMTAASFADAALRLAGRKTGEGRWTRVTPAPYDDEVDMDIQGPGARGWFAAANMGDLEEGGVVVFGGKDEANRRLGDGWIFRLG